MQARNRLRVVVFAAFVMPTAAVGDEAIDKSTQRNGMHCCPAGQFMTGLHAGNNWLLCADGTGDFDNEQVDNSSKSHGMHACPPGQAATGIHLGANLLSCVTVLTPEPPPVVDRSTARMGMHACPPGMPVSGVFEANNLLLCGMEPGGANGVCAHHGALHPRYMVLTIIYAPPGTSGKQLSFVDYSTGSTTGVKTSTGKSFKNSASVEASAKLPVFSASLSGGYDYQKSSSTTIDMRKSASIEIKVPGGGQRRRHRS